MELTVTAKDLRAGDVVIGSGFVVTRNAWIDYRGTKRAVVTGNYPGSPVKQHLWNRGTRVPVLRNA